MTGVLASACSRCVATDGHRPGCPEGFPHVTTQDPSDTPEPRLYLITRRDLPWSVRVVQVAHAAASLTQRHRPDSSAWGPYGPAIVLYGVADQASLARVYQHLDGSAQAFWEPDLGDQMTALAYLGQPHPAFAGLRLL